MKNLAPIEELRVLLSKCAGIVAYQPLAGEIDCIDSSFPVDIKTLDIFLLPNQKNTDPFMWADQCLNYYKNSGSYICILVPGLKFDVFGTRHGKGGGWYDRFLSKIPKNWPRIGVAFASQLSPIPLPRQKHDQPVDWVLVKDKKGWFVSKTPYTSDLQ